MNVAEMRELSLEELRTRISETRKEILDLRFQRGLRKLDSTAKLKASRKTLARLLTIETQKLNQDKN